MQANAKENIRLGKSSRRHAYYIGAVVLFFFDTDKKKQM